MKNFKYKAFLLDNDGVICDSNKLHWAGYRDIIKKYYPDIDYTMEEHNTLLGINTYDTFVNILKNHGYEESVTKEKTIEKIKLMEEEKKALFVKQCEQTTPEVLFDGMAKFLRSAYEQGIVLVACSSSSTAGIMLENANVRKYFSYVVNPKSLKDCLTEESKKQGKMPGKPAPDIFEVGFIRASEFLQGLTKDQVLGFEDATNGVASIKGAGIDALYVGNPDSPANKKAFEEKYKLFPDFVVNHSSEITLNKLVELTN